MQAHSDVIQKLLKKARKGTKSACAPPRAPAAAQDTFLRPRAHAIFLPPAVIVLPGNHDEALRDYLQDYKMELGSSITVQLEATHTTADGRRFLVLHGDRCDVIRHGAHPCLRHACCSALACAAVLH